jgi:hypothetical protein
MLTQVQQYCCGAPVLLYVIHGGASLLPPLDAQTVPASAERNFTADSWRSNKSYFRSMSEIGDTSDETGSDWEVETDFTCANTHLLEILHARLSIFLSPAYLGKLDEGIHRELNLALLRSAASWTTAYNGSILGNQC